MKLSELEQKIDESKLRFREIYSINPTHLFIGRDQEKFLYDKYFPFESSIRPDSFSLNELLGLKIYIIDKEDIIRVGLLNKL